MDISYKKAECVDSLLIHKIFFDLEGQEVPNKLGEKISCGESTLALSAPTLYIPNGTTHLMQQWDIHGLKH